MWELEHPELLWVCSDKYKSYVMLEKYYKRKVMLLEDRSSIAGISQEFTGHEIVIKPRYGTEGKDILFYSANNNKQSFVEFLHRKSGNGSYIIEEVIKNHRVLQEVSPNSLNTVRIISVFHNGVCNILSAALRMGNGARTDNVATGGLVAAIDIEYGTICGPAVSGNPTDEEKCIKHPLTGMDIVGLRIPFWDGLKSMIQEMSRTISDIKSVGWDIAITPTGPLLIEINNHWDSSIMQISNDIGILPELAPYVSKSVLYPAHRKLFKTLVEF